MAERRPRMKSMRRQARTSTGRQLILGLLLALSVGCSAPSQSPEPTTEAAVEAQRVTPSIPSAPGVQPAPASPTTQVAPRPTPVGSASLDQGDPTRFVYRWPSFLPEGMRPSPNETRIAREDEVGDGDIGFYLVTFNGDTGKIVIGGGAVEPFSLSGTIERVSIGAYTARLVTQDDQTLVVVDDGAPGTLFIFGAGVARDDLLRVVASLAPIDPHEMRRRAGVE
ncbi:MAG: hypothetical protein C0183_17770 [Roseiflexus castenholzii]|nr:MAG: hypothetical protein C0183_17770 [Roseiflexus castenholzii]